MFSKRAERLFAAPSFLATKSGEAMSNPYHPVHNKQGIINLGLAENSLCGEELIEKIKTLIHFQPHCQFYASPFHMTKVKEKIGKFLEVFFKSKEPIEPERIIVYNGATAIVAGLANVLADRGEYFITPTPMYSQFESDIEDVPGVGMCYVPLENQIILTDERNGYILTADALERALRRAKEEGKVVRAFLLSNPSNPMGDIYSPSLVTELMHVCKRFRIHFISDEVYGLTVFDERQTFTSTLAMDDIPDPQRTHFIWSASKDFALSGLRIGVLVSRNDDLINALNSQGYLFSAAVPLLEAFAEMLTDTVWLQQEYFPTNLKRIRASYEYMKRGLENIGVQVRSTGAAFFLWVNFKKELEGHDHDIEMKFFTELMEERGVFLLPGTTLLSPTPGYFRIVFTHPEPVLQEALSRIKRMFSTWHAVVNSAKKLLQVVHPKMAMTSFNATKEDKPDDNKLLGLSEV